MNKSFFFKKKNNFSRKEKRVAKAVISEPSNFQVKKSMPKVDNGKCIFGRKWHSLKRIPQWPIKVKYEIKTSAVYPSRDEKRLLAATRILATFGSGQSSITRSYLDVHSASTANLHKKRSSSWGYTYSKPIQMRYSR